MCVDCRTELIKLIKEELTAGGKVSSHVNLSTEFDYFRCNNILYLTIKNVKENMQKDGGAFDSWALVIKNWVSDIDKIILKWDKPENTKDPHYQRFLYRVEKATEVYEWLEVEGSCKPLLDDLLIKSGHRFVVNVPISEAQENAAKEEAKVERMFVNCYNQTLANAANIDNTTLHNQLPVGLFKDDIADANRIFPSSNAMIDIWGLNKDKTELHIFELKEPNKYPVGIYSELFFYSMFEKDIINEKFIYKDKDKIKDYRGINELIKSNCKSLKAHFLTTKLHPLIDSKMINLINNALKSKNIQFDYIKYHMNENQEIEI